MLRLCEPVRLSNTDLVRLSHTERDWTNKVVQILALSEIILTLEKSDMATILSRVMASISGNVKRKMQLFLHSEYLFFFWIKQFVVKNAVNVFWTIRRVSCVRFNPYIFINNMKLYGVQDKNKLFNHVFQHA